MGERAETGRPAATNSTSRRKSEAVDFIEDKGQIAQGDQTQAVDKTNLSLVTQRKSIVSIRLTDPEIAVLRDRAVESGISVSAYMRSCVLEAETLRAQVKQAMAEMRSLSTSSQLRPFPPLSISGHHENVSSAEKLRGFLRSITSFLSPLLTFRRSA